MADRPRLLLIDDGEAYAEAIAAHMPQFELVDPGSGPLPRLPDGPAALDYLDGHADAVDVVLLDMRFDVPEDRLLPLPEAPSVRRLRRFQGVAILREIRRRFPDLPVVLLTAMADLSLGDIAAELAAQSMTYVLDGDDLDALRIRVHAALESAARAQEEDDVLWGRDRTLRALRRRLAVLARGRLPVILEGETGTGKSYLAERFIHAHSGRAGPFVVCDLATVPADLISAHLFGAMRGAYTGAVADRKGVFELADKGTLFIDEIQNVPGEVQKQLLLVLQDHKVRPLGGSREITVDVKVVAASNQSLGEAVRAGRFRADLYMRLSPATRVLLPPLRDRTSDLPFLAKRFTERAVDEPEIAALRDRVCSALDRPFGAPLQLVVGRAEADADGLQLALPEPAWRRLAAHPWPGNLRELSMVMHNLVTFTLVAAVDAIEAGLPLSSGRLQVDAGLVADLLSGAPSLGGNEGPRGPDVVPIHLEPQPTLNAVSVAVERQYFVHLFQQTDGDFEAMAERLLGSADRSRAIRLRLNQLGLKVRDLRQP
ncbi:MAG: sigma-54-dependent Fis family transcriptional regulator [Myxococcales bacterium]|nr:sigma-54-dependent Fis family transcriptional regulator [Myxococcales bacterium]